MKVWQGTFPSDDTGADGLRGSARSTRSANGHGLHNSTGTVWE